VRPCWRLRTCWRIETCWNVLCRRLPLLCLQCLSHAPNNSIHLLHAQQRVSKLRIAAHLYSTTGRLLSFLQARPGCRHAALVPVRLAAPGGLPVGPQPAAACSSGPPAGHGRGPRRLQQSCSSSCRCCGCYCCQCCWHTHHSRRCGSTATATTFTTPVPAGKPAGKQQPQPQQPSPSSNMPAGPPIPPAGLLFDWLLPLLTGRVPLPTGSPAPLQLQVLICKTLIYALQQLPSCTPAEANTAATSAAVAAGAVAGTNPPGATAGSSVQPAAAAAVGSTTGHPALLVAPVPEAAAQQLRQHGSAVLAAVQELLEGATTPPQLLAPLLQLLLEVIRLDVSVITGGAATANLHMHWWFWQSFPDWRGTHVISGQVAVCRWSVCALLAGNTSPASSAAIQSMEAAVRHSALQLSLPGNRLCMHAIPAWPLHTRALCCETSNACQPALLMCQPALFEFCCCGGPCVPAGSVLRDCEQCT
jgi:hypothetical protein